MDNKTTVGDTIQVENSKVVWCIKNGVTGKETFLTMIDPKSSVMYKLIRIKCEEKNL